MAESKLWVLTEAKQEAISKREEILKDSQRIFAEQGLVDWNMASQKIEMKRMCEERMGVEV